MPRPVSNPPNPWQSIHAEWLGEPPAAELEVFEEEARSIISENDSPDIGFRYSVNPYRGCFHSCAYCLDGSTLILMADGRTKALADVRVGDEVYGTARVGRYRQYVKTTVLNHWQRIASCYRIELEDGTELIASGEHRFLTQRGWKRVACRASDGSQQPHLTTGNHLLGTGAFTATPEETVDYQTGYLCGMIRGDGHLASYAYDGRRRKGVDTVHQFRLALVDLEGLQRTQRFLRAFEIETRDFLFQAAAAGRKPLQAIRTSAAARVARIAEVIRWPSHPDGEWRRGFLAGIFDAEGSYNGGILRITNTDTTIIRRIAESLAFFGFDHIVETRPRARPIYDVRIRRGIREHLRFFHTVDPAITRKRSIAGHAIKNTKHLRVVSARPVGLQTPLFDITTATGDFIANGVVSHNCYARPTHQYLGWGAGTDFDRKIVAKVNAPELLRRELLRPSWKGETIVFSGVTDCYQPLEAVYGLTRRCLEVCREFRNPVGIVTKGALIRRDLDVLSALAKESAATVYVSVPFADDRTARAMEPNVGPPSQRLETIAALAAAGVRTGVAVAPIIPGLNDSDIPNVLSRARAAGATNAFLTLLRLPAEVLPVFQERLTAAFPDRASRIWSNLRQARGGKLNESRFGSRMEGVGPRWTAIETLFEVECRRLGLSQVGEQRPHTSTFRRPPAAQKTLFGES